MVTTTSPLAVLLRKHFEARGYAENGGQERFRILLAEKYGIAVSAQTISYWLKGDRRPSLGKLIGLLDALDIHGEERDAAIRAAAGSPLVDAPEAA
jgi:transcriptional regulator with XRE-family HTH domain